MYRRIAGSITIIIVMLGTVTAQAKDRVGETNNTVPITTKWEIDRLRLRTSLYTVHYNPSAEHQNHQKLINIEAVRRDDWLMGFAYFRNSFDQPSEYLYLGKEWSLWQPTADFRLRGTITAGLLHGYKGKYKNKVPLNKFGVSPAILPTIGVEYKNIFLEAQFFALAGVMVTAGFSFPLD